VAAAKGPDAFRTISEAAVELGVPQHVLRFWETKFSFIRPMKRGGGRRFYRRQDIDILRGVRTLLHEEGYTIKGVQRLHKAQGYKYLLAAAQGGAPMEASPDALARAETAAPTAVLSDTSRQRLSMVLDDLESIKARIDTLLLQS
jgi:DNA-binding transcriptional MerR regulator